MMAAARYREERRMESCGPHVGRGPALEPKPRRMREDAASSGLT